jgi:ArsR family transcriptional regulator, arsenate/arsenite/antimonite-responsive transcriptional repressor
MTENKSARNEMRAVVLKSLAHPSRLFIVEKLMEAPHCVCELTELIGADTSTVSKHLSVLKNAGVVVSRKEGTTVYYSLTCDCIGGIIDSVETVLRNALDKRVAAMKGSE